MSIKQKVQISLMFGLIYWGFNYILIKLNLSWLDKFLPLFLDVALPFIFGYIIIIFLKDHAYVNLLFCPIIILVYYFIDLIRNYILLPKPYDPFSMTWHFFSSVGIISILLAIFGGALSILIVRKLHLKTIG